MDDKEILDYVFGDEAYDLGSDEQQHRLEAALKELRAEAEAAFTTGWGLGHEAGFDEGYTAGLENTAS